MRLLLTASVRTTQAAAAEQQAEKMGAFREVDETVIFYLNLWHVVKSTVFI